MLTITNLSIQAMVTIYIIATAILTILLWSKKLDYRKSKAAFFIFSNLIVSVFLYYCLQSKFSINHLFPVITICFGFVNLIILILLKLYQPIHGILFLFLTVFSVSFSYISYTPYYIRQHDSRQFWDYTWRRTFWIYWIYFSKSSSSYS